MALFDQMQDMIVNAAQNTAAQAGTTPSGGAAAGAGAATGLGGTAASSLDGIDVDAVLTAKATEKGGKSNWRTSIADLMQLLDLDNSLTNRKELASELGYTGALDGSAEMNIWLHRQVMNKLAANGGVVPSDLKD